MGDPTGDPDWLAKIVLLRKLCFMSYSSVLFYIYLFLTAVSIMMTYIESTQKPKETKGYSFLGMALCCAWPVVVLVLLAIRAGEHLKAWRAGARGNLSRD